MTKRLINEFSETVLSVKIVETLKEDVLGRKQEPTSISVLLRLDFLRLSEEPSCMCDLSNFHNLYVCGDLNVSFSKQLTVMHF